MLINYIKEISNKQPTNFHNYATESYKGFSTQKLTDAQE